MNRIIILCLAVLVFEACKSESEEYIEKNPPREKTGIVGLQKTNVRFIDTFYDFGKVIEGDSPVHVYKFTNVGEEDFLISDVLTTCGCTVPSYPKSPIMRGDTGEVTVAYKTEGRVGVGNKTVRVYSNAQQGVIQLSFTIEVLPKKE